MVPYLPPNARLNESGPPIPTASVGDELILNAETTADGQTPPNHSRFGTRRLKVLWDLGQATVREALETLRAAGRQWSYATVATLLDRLESKGLVTSDRSELAFVYRPTISNQEVRQRRLNSLVNKLYQGEPGLLVLHLLKSHPLDAGQAKEVRSVLDQMSSEKSKKKDANKVAHPASVNELHPR